MKKSCGTIVKELIGRPNINIGSGEERCDGVRTYGELNGGVRNWGLQAKIN